MEIIQDFIRPGRRNRPGRLNPCRFITIHETGNRNPTADALNHARFLHGDSAANAPTSWHYTVDDLRVVQHLPDNEDGFHAGDGGGAGNRQSIGIEICVNNRLFFRQACENAARLTARLLNTHGLDTDDIRQHFDWSRKNCPQILRSGEWGITWQDFLQMVEGYREMIDVVNFNITIDGEKRDIDVFGIGGRSFFPVAVLRDFGFIVEWDEATKTVELTTPKNSDSGEFRAALTKINTIAAGALR